MSRSTKSGARIQSRGPVQPKNLVKFPVHFNCIYIFVSTWNLFEARRTSKAMMSSGSLPMSVTKRTGVLVFNPWSWSCIACVREAATEMKVNMVLARCANTALGWIGFDQSGGNPTGLQTSPCLSTFCTLPPLLPS